MTFDHLPPPSLWRNHDEAHQAFYAELAQQPKPTRPRKRKPTLAGVARQSALPPTLTPRLISRDDAAAWEGHSHHSDVPFPWRRAAHATHRLADANRRVRHDNAVLAQRASGGI